MMSSVSELQKPAPAGLLARLSRRRPMRLVLRRMAREPLVHFIVIAALAFVAWPFLSSHVATAPNQITITAGQMQRASEIFAASHARAPNRDELAALVEQEIRSEVFFREGLALGLDRGDEIIRRRVEQKMRFMVQDVALASAPDDAELQLYLDAHPARYASEAQYAFDQVYIDPARHGASADKYAQELLARLTAADGRLNYERDSDPLPFSNAFENTPLHAISGIFGEEFAASLASLPVGRWSGPIHSGYGLHLVFLHQRLEGPPPVLSKIRDNVLRDWQADRREMANEQAYADMRAKYLIDVQLPQ